MALQAAKRPSYATRRSQVAAQAAKRPGRRPRSSEAAKPQAQGREAAKPQKQRRSRRPQSGRDTRQGEAKSRRTTSLTPREPKRPAKDPTPRRCEPQRRFGCVGCRWAGADRPGGPVRARRVVENGRTAVFDDTPSTSKSRTDFEVRRPGRSRATPHPTAHRHPAHPKSRASTSLCVWSPPPSVRNRGGVSGSGGRAGAVGGGAPLRRACEGHPNHASPPTPKTERARRGGVPEPAGKQALLPDPGAPPPSADR